MNTHILGWVVLVVSMLSGGAGHAEEPKEVTSAQVSINQEQSIVKVSTTDIIAKININTASATQLAETLKGIGIKKAKAIVAFRDELGGFKTVEQLLDVKGIGMATLEKNRTLISL